jgi:16S rRNA (adenine1518-N6/adenine1519-N6)-dimethyltransferase
MHDPLNASALLSSFGIKPKKQLGQNFIVQKSALEQVLAAASLGENEQILEIGAGLGALTLELARRNHHIVAVEYDQRLIPILHSVLAGYESVNVVHGDILHLDLKELLFRSEYQVVANIPYQITSAVIRKLMETPYPARSVILTIQREVAERIIAKPGNLSLLALSVQLFGQPKIHSHIPARAFYPQPKVESSVLRIDMDPQPKIPAEDLNIFFRIAKAGFSQKRKQLRNALAGGMRISTQKVEEIMVRADLSPTRRAQELDLGEWQRLYWSFKSKNSGDI